jgi:hypothetical protein
MPDLDQIKQGEQELGISAGGSPRGRPGNPAGRAAAVTASTALPGYCSPTRAAADPQSRRASARRRPAALRLCLERIVEPIVSGRIHDAANPQRRRLGGAKGKS